MSVRFTLHRYLQTYRLDNQDIRSVLLFQSGRSGSTRSGYACSSALRFHSVSALAYTSVVFMSVWPRKSRIEMRFTPAWSRWTAFECLSIWHFTEAGTTSD